MREVAVVGVGMTPFGANRGLSRRELVYRAGTEALANAGASFADVGSVYMEYINSPMMSGVRFAKEWSLTGAPAVHVEDASATGAVAFREAYLTVAGGAADTAMAVGFDTLEQLAVPGMSRFSVKGAILPAEEVLKSRMIADPHTSMMCAGSVSCITILGRAAMPETHEHWTRHTAESTPELENSR